MRRKRMLLLLCLLLCVCCAFSGFAASSPDLTKTGSIQFRILSDYDPVPGGDLWLMRVCDVTKDSNGQLRYAWVPALQHLKFRPEDAFDFEHAKLIRDEALKNGASSQRIWIDADGRAASLARTHVCGRHRRRLAGILCECEVPVRERGKGGV